MTKHSVIRANVIRAFTGLQKVFPFSEYMNDKSKKYFELAKLIDQRGYSSGSTILSIGSGPCDFEAILSKLGYKVTAIDDLKDQWHLLGQNRQRIKDFAEQNGVDLKVASAETPRFGGACFDVVMLLDVD